MLHFFRPQSLKTALNDSVRRIGVPVCLCGLWIACVFTASARADFLIYADVTTNLGGNPSRQQGTSGTVVNAADRALNNLFASARSSSTFGQLKAYGRYSAQDGGVSGGWAWGTAGFRDDFLFNAAGLTGTTGTVEMKFTVDGTLNASRASSLGFQSGVDDIILAAVDYAFTPGVNRETVRKTEGLITSTHAAAYGIGQNQGSPFLGIEQTFTVPFTFGTTLESVALEIRARANAARTWGLTAVVESDIEHTANWGGFGAVRDANGNVLSNYTFSSGSGFDYTVGVTAVPEPSSCILVAACLGLGFVRRFRIAKRQD